VSVRWPVLASSSRRQLSCLACRHAPFQTSLFPCPRTYKYLPAASTHSATTPVPSIHLISPLHTSPTHQPESRQTTPSDIDNTIIRKPPIDSTHCSPRKHPNRRTANLFGRSALQQHLTNAPSHLDLHTLKPSKTTCSTPPSSSPRLPSLAPSLPRA